MKKKTYIEKKLNEIESIIGHIITEYVESKLDPDKNSFENFDSCEFTMMNPYLIFDDLDPDGRAPQYFTIDRYIDMLADDQNYTEKEKAQFARMVAFKYAKYVINGGKEDEYLDIDEINKIIENEDYN